MLHKPRVKSPVMFYEPMDGKPWQNQASLSTNNTTSSHTEVLYKRFNCVYISFVITKLLMIKEITVDMFLNQALAGEGWLSGFLNYFGVDVGMHVYVCMYVCVSAPQAKNHSSKMKPE